MPRHKLTETQRQQIKNRTDTSTAQLAREYNVSRRTIYFIKNPDKAAENNQRGKDRYRKQTTNHPL